MMLVAGSSSLASQIASKLGSALVQTNTTKFASGEIKVELHGEFSAQNVCIIQSTAPSPNDSFMELFLMIDAIKRCAPKSITVVMPYMAYARQDRKEAKSITSSVACIANLLQALGIDKIITVDIHSDSAKNSFKIPLVNIEMTDVFALLIGQKENTNKILISPDEGSRARVEKLSAKLHLPCAIIQKSRDSSNIAKAVSISNDVAGKECYLIDDMVDTSGTLLSAVDLLFSNGAQAVHAYITHGLFSKDCLKLIERSPLNSLTITNTVDVGLEIMPKNINIIDISEIIVALLRE